MWCFQLLKCENLLPFLVLQDSKLIFGFWTVCRTKQDIWRRHIGLKNCCWWAFFTVLLSFNARGIPGGLVPVPAGTGWEAGCSLVAKLSQGWHIWKNIPPTLLSCGTSGDNKNGLLTQMINFLWRRVTLAKPITASHRAHHQTNPPVHLQLVKDFRSQVFLWGQHRGRGDWGLCRRLSCLLRARVGTVWLLRGPGPPPLVTVHSNLQQGFKITGHFLILFLNFLPVAEKKKKHIQSCSSLEKWQLISPEVWHLWRSSPVLCRLCWISQGRR